MEHKPEIDWCMGEISMMRCPTPCRPKATEEMNWPNCISANMTWRQLKTHLHRQVHVEEVPEFESTHMEAKPSPGFMQPDPDELDEGDRLLVQFIGIWSEEIRATQTISQQLAEAAGGTSSTCFEDIVPKPYQEFWDVFTKESFDKLPNQKQWDHTIELVPDTCNFSTKVYPLAPVKQKQLDKFLDENLKSQHICLSKSPMASPVFFIKKKDGSLRLVQDYRKLNAVTVKNAYPLPLIPDILNKVSEAKAKYFTKLDVRWGYNNIRIKEGDGWKATFQMNRGLFEPLVMFFSLTNSPATFQMMMNDILIFSGRMKEKHHSIVVKVLDILQKHRLYLKVEKCIFEQPRVKYLGLILSEGHIEMDPVKVAGIQDWPTPKNVTKVQSFVGFINFY